MIWENNQINNEKPPTLYSIMNSIVNYKKDSQTKIKDLATTCREQIFNFEYPLTNKINKADFETLILNKFIMRRIGYETLTAFQIALNVKLNEIMPTYNKMFDMLDGWNLFNDGESTTRVLTESGTGSENNTNSNTYNTDTRYAELPQNQLSDLQDGTYVTDYTIQHNTNNGTNNTSTTQSNTLNETLTRTPGDKIRIYKDFIENKNNIYTMIFQDLSCLFYGIL